MTDVEAILALQRQWLAAGDPDSQRELASEALVHAADALHTLVSNLNATGYPWARIDRVNPSVLSTNIHRIEKVMGTAIPEVLVLFWELVGGVMLVDLENYRHVDYWEAQGLHTAPFCDGLVVEPCSREWADYVCGDYLDWQGNWPADSPEPFLLSLSPDGYHKDNISGGAPYGLFFGEPWRPTWQYFEWPGTRRPLSAPPDPPDFLAYLRTTVLECAGFPGLLGQRAFEPFRDRLLQDMPLF